MKKILSFLLLGLICSIGNLWAETVTMNLALAKNSTPSPSIGTALLNGGAFDGSGYKMGSDGNYVGWDISASEKIFTAVTFNGYINTTNTEKNWGFDFSTDGGLTWSSEVTQANDGTKSYHDISVTVNIPSGANAIRIYRRAGTSSYVSSITLTIEDVAAAESPVTAASISGAVEGMAGLPIIYTATAENANLYAWYVDGVLQDDETSKSFVYVAELGDHSIYCTATNELTATPVQSNTINVSISKLCGELIKATHTGATTATVTGLVGGTVDKNTQGTSKLGTNGHYFGVKLASGNFLAGDVVTITASTLNDGNTATLFSDKGEHSLGSAAFDGETKIATITLTESATWVYLYRVNSSCNPNVESISVSRSCEESDDNSIASLTINGNEVEAVAGVYSLELSNSYVDENVTVAYTLGHPLASATPASGFTIAVPAAGAAANTQVIAVTAENGDVANYTVSITKSTTLSDDASLSALSVAGLTLVPEFDPEVSAYTVIKAYGAATPAVGDITATPNDVNANAVVSLDGNVFSIVVTAEDNSDATYTITVQEKMKAPSISGLSYFIGNQTVTISSDVDGAILSYSLDGENFSEYIDGVVLSENKNVLAKASKVGYVESDVVSFNSFKVDVADAQVEVSDAFVWDFSDDLDPGDEINDNAERVELLSSVSGYEDKDGANQISFLGRNAYRTGYAQAHGFIINTTVSGTLSLKVRGTNSNTRKIFVNGVEKGTVKSSGTDVNIDNIVIPAGKNIVYGFDVTAVPNAANNIRYYKIEFTPDVEITLGANGYSTYAADYKFSVSGAEVYRAAYDGELKAVVLTQLASPVVPANTGVILKGVAGEEAVIARSSEDAADMTGNRLIGVVAATPAPANAYVISTNAGVTEFNPCQEALMIPAHKAYLIIESATPAPVRVIFAENGATAIDNIEGADDAVKFVENGVLYIRRNGVVYTTTGQVVR